MKLLAWLNERTGLDQVWRVLFARQIPNLKSPVAWFYTLGSAGLFVFVLQVLTGVLLAANYVPSPDHAYDSVKFINEQVWFGGLIRGLHHWGASAMVVLVVLHMLRVYFMGAYKCPRELTWIMGVLLLLFVLAFGFTGYLLPWDQKAYWATAVGTNIAGQSPVVGPLLIKLLRGGQEMGAATLSRFYALHVLVLPMIVGLLLVGHLFLVVWHGISEPPKRHEVAKGAKGKGQPFFPDSVFKDVVVAFLVFCVLLFLAYRIRVPLEEVADPTDSTYNPRPEWYFLFLFQALKFFPGRLEAVAAVLLPCLAILMLLLVPFLDRKPERHPLDRPAWTALALMVISGIAWLAWVGARGPLVNPVVKQDPLVLAGQRLYRELKCAYCHRIHGQGGTVGPELDKAAGTKTERWLWDHFRDPQAVNPGSVMPKFGLLDDETRALVAYVISFAPEPFTEEAPRLFADRCAACHRIGKEGAEVGPDLSLIGRTRDKSFIKTYIENPSLTNPTSAMPSYKSQLTDTQIEDLARYLASLVRE